MSRLNSKSNKAARDRTVDSRAVRDRTVDKALVRAKDKDKVKVVAMVDKAMVVAVPQVATPITRWIRLLAVHVVNLAPPGARFVMPSVKLRLLLP